MIEKVAEEMKTVVGCPGPGYLPVQPGAVPPETTGTAAYRHLDLARLKERGGRQERKKEGDIPQQNFVYVL